MPRFITMVLPLFYATWFIAEAGYGFFLRGTDNTNYLWLQNLTLLGTALGLYLHNRGILRATLGLYLIAAAPWLVDNAFRPFTHANLLHLNEELYRPGIALPEFIFGHDFWFTLPALLLGMKLFPKGKLHPVVAPSVLFVIFVASYFYDGEKNVNYIHSSFIEMMSQWRGPIYSALSTAACILLHFFMTHLSDRLFSPIPSDNSRKKRHVYAATTAAFLFAFAFLTFDLRYLMAQPTLQCGSPFNGKDIGIRCRYTSDFGDRWVILTYSMLNKTNIVRECVSFYERNGEKILIQDSLVLWPGKDTKLDILWPYPKETFTINLSATCKNY